MSSETSTKPVRLKADAAADPGLQPWQFFVLAALGCATAVTFIARGRGPAAIILLSVLMATAAFVGFAALRMLRPLVSPEDDRTVMIGQRTRAALEREKTLALRSIKELEFDKAMGRVSDEDFKEMSSRLRAQCCTNASSSRINGLGPTRDISPLMTLISCGSSSIENRRRYLPLRVTRGSSGIFVIRGSRPRCMFRCTTSDFRSSASATIVRNL